MAEAPTLPQPLPPKPFNIRLLIFIVCGILIAFFVVSAAISALYHALPAAHKATPEPLKEAVSPDQIADYNNAVRRQAEQFPKQPAPPSAAGQVLADLAGGIPEGTPEQRSAQLQFDPTGRQSAGVEQSSAGNNGGVSLAQQAKLDAKARRLEALHASAIIASQTESAAPPPQPPAATGPATEPEDSGVNAPQVAPISAAVAPLVQNAAAVKHYPWNSAFGQLYRLLEGTVIESVMRNQLMESSPDRSR